MALSANSYGSVGDVAVYVPMHTDSNGDFTSATNPKLATVENWIDQLSAAINLELDNYGYSVPASGNLNTWLDGFVSQEVAAQVRAIYQRTRRGPAAEGQQEEGPRSLLTNINDVRDMLQSLARGDKGRAGSHAITRADAYSDNYSTTDVDT